MWRSGSVAPRFFCFWKILGKFPGIPPPVMWTIPWILNFCGLSKLPSKLSNKSRWNIFDGVKSISPHVVPFCHSFLCQSLPKFFSQIFLANEIPFDLRTRPFRPIIAWPFATVLFVMIFSFFMIPTALAPHPVPFVISPTSAISPPVIMIFCSWQAFANDAIMASISFGFILFVSKVFVRLVTSDPLQMASSATIASKS